MLQLIATHRNTLQHTATHCNALQRTATQAVEYAGGYTTLTTIQVRTVAMQKQVGAGGSGKGRGLFGLGLFGL